MVEGLKKAAGRIQNHIAQVPDRTVQIDEQGQKVIQERQPPTTMCQLIDMLPTAAIDDIWTHEEEERFLSMTWDHVLNVRTMLGRFETYMRGFARTGRRRAFICPGRPTLCVRSSN